MHIDFAPPSNGIYNNSGSSRQLANYLEHEDMERIEQGIYTEDFFSLIEDNIYKSKVIKDIDSNIGQLLKTDAKFYAIHVSPSEKELRAMGNTEQEQAEAMKRYIRKVFIPEYAKNFNKELSTTDIKFFGKIHFDRSRSDNELNMHCHLIVSRKDQSNKLKISPLTNHRNTKKGVITGGFDRTVLLKKVERKFDKLFGYNRQLFETFEYCNTMKNGNISDRLQIQEWKLRTLEQNIAYEKKEEMKQTGIYADEQEKTENKFANKQENNIENKQDFNSSNLELSSSFRLLTPDTKNRGEEQPPMKRKKKKPKQGLRK